MSGSKYLRTMRPVSAQDAREIVVDVYSVLEAFKVTCPATAHAIKKLLCAGLRGKNDRLGDLHEARDAVSRAVELELQRGDAQ